MTMAEIVWSAYVAAQPRGRVIWINPDTRGGFGYDPGRSARDV